MPEEIAIKRVAAGAAREAQTLAFQFLNAFKFACEVGKDCFLYGSETGDLSAVANVVHFPTEGFVVEHPRGAVACTQGVQLLDIFSTILGPELIPLPFLQYF